MLDTVCFIAQYCQNCVRELGLFSVLSLINVQSGQHVMHLQIEGEFCALTI